MKNVLFLCRCRDANVYYKQQSNCGIVEPAFSSKRKKEEFQLKIVLLIQWNNTIFSIFFYFVLFLLYFYKLCVVYQQYRLSICETSTNSIELFSNQNKYFVVIFVNNNLYHKQPFRAPISLVVIDGSIDRSIHTVWEFILFAFSFLSTFAVQYRCELSLWLQLLFFLFFNSLQFQYRWINSICFIRLRIIHLISLARMRVL